jgi:hypothetical protein
MKTRLLYIVALLAATASAYAQQTSFTGTVTDASGAIVRHANVVAENTNGGAAYKTVTNESGAYQLPAITAATYTLRVDAPGFAVSEKKISVLVGQVLEADFSLVPASASTTVSVSTEAASIDTTSSNISGEIDPDAVSKLPLNGRNYLQLATLVPGVRVNAITSSLLPAYSTGSTQIHLDGQETTNYSSYLSVGSAVLYSRDAISEFQVITNRFDATLGRSSQIQINIQTKSGGNATHGSAFGYFRNDVFDAADPIAHKVVPFSDQQYGGTVGGPVRKDKLFYFASFEAERQPNTIVLNPYGFTSTIPIYTHSTQVSTREYLTHWDYVPNSRDHFSLRVSGDTWGNPYSSAALSTGTASPTQIYSTKSNDYAPQLTWSTTRGPNIVNELKAGLHHTGGESQPSTNALTVYFPSTTIGGNYNLPNNSSGENQSYRDDFFWLHGKHSVKLGGEYIHALYHGTFDMYSRGAATLSQDLTNLPTIFPDLTDPSTWNLAALNPYVLSYTQSFGNDHFRLPRNIFGTWVQDDWKVTHRLTINAGVRYDNDIGVFDPHVTLISGLKQPTSGDNHEFAPRLGLTVDPTGSGKTVIRGGAGIFYTNIMTNMIEDASLFNGQTSVAPTITPTAGNPVNLVNPFGTTTPADILANPTAYRQTVQVMAPGVETPWAAQASIGVQREIRNGLTISADYLHDRTHHDWIRVDKNLYQDPVTGFNKNPSTAGRPNPLYAAILTFVTPGNVGNIYDALLVNLQQRDWHGLTGSAAYTLSREKDNNHSGPFGYANNPFNFAGDWAKGLENQLHTLNVSSDYRWRYGLHGGLLYHYGSGANFSTTAGGSPTGLGTYATNRTYCGVDATNATCPHVIDPVHKDYTHVYNNPIHNHLDLVSGFDITDSDQLVGRPIQRIDANLAKDITFSDHLKAIVQVEAFNVLNHSNYGSYNGSITSPAYGQPASTSGTLSYYPRMLQFSARLQF